MHTLCDDEEAASRPFLLRHFLSATSSTTASRRTSSSRRRASSRSRPASESKRQSISIHVVHFDPADRQDKLPVEVYGCLAILTNVSSLRQSVEILCQIQMGSISVSLGFRTKTNFATVVP